MLNPLNAVTLNSSLSHKIVGYWTWQWGQLCRVGVPQGGGPSLEMARVGDTKANPGGSESKAGLRRTLGEQLDTDVCHGCFFVLRAFVHCDCLIYFI